MVYVYIDVLLQLTTIFFSSVLRRPSCMSLISGGLGAGFLNRLVCSLGCCVVTKAFFGSMLLRKLTANDLNFFPCTSFDDMRIALNLPSLSSSTLHKSVGSRTLFWIACSMQSPSKAMAWLCLNGAWKYSW